MTESDVRLAIWFVPVVSGTTVVLINWTNKYLANKKAIAFKNLEENSLGETLAAEIKEELSQARKERAELRQRMEDAEEMARKHRIENADAIHRFGHQGLQDIQDLLSEIKQLKKNI